MIAHYAFALGYNAGLKGEGDCPFDESSVYFPLWTAGYEQGTADDLFGEANFALFNFNL